MRWIKLHAVYLHHNEQVIRNNKHTTDRYRNRPRTAELANTESELIYTTYVRLLLSLHEYIAARDAGSCICQ